MTTQKAQEFDATLNRDAGGSATPAAPAIGALFTYDGAGFRVTGYLKEYVAPPIDTSTVTGRLIAEILAEEAAMRGNRPAPKRWRWCSREESTHVTGSGVCGCIAPITEIIVTGMVDWSAEELAQAEHEAKMLIGKMIF